MSIKWVVFLLMLVIAGFGWLFLAADYAKVVEGWKPPDSRNMDNVRVSGYLRPRRGAVNAMADAVRGTISATANAFRQIPNAPAVFLFGVTQRQRAVIGFAAVECLTIAFGVWLKRLERKLDEPQERPRSED